MHAPNELDRLRVMAERLDCFLEEDFQLLADATAGTVESWRKRGTGPAYILLGKRYLYPRDSLSQYLKSVTRERSGGTGFSAAKVL